MSHNLSRDCAAWKMGPRVGGLVAENPFINIVWSFQVALKNCSFQVTSMDVGWVSPSVPAVCSAQCARMPDCVLIQRILDPKRLAFSCVVARFCLNFGQRSTCSYLQTMGAANGKQKEDFAQAAAITREVVADMVKARNNDIERGAGQGQTVNQKPVHPSGETASQTLARCSRSVMDADLHSGRSSRWLSGKPSPSQLITTVTTVPSPLQTVPPSQNTSTSVATATQTEWSDELEELTCFDVEAVRAVFMWNAIQVQASALVLYFFWNENDSCDLYALKHWAAAYTVSLYMCIISSWRAFMGTTSFSGLHRALQCNRRTDILEPRPTDKILPSTERTASNAM